jgi:site-specific DNA-methyltransferase (adenine-specific)
MNYQLYNADCFEILKSMSNKSVDHIITDPPYSERVHVGARGGNEAKKTIHQANSLIDFKFISEADFLKFCDEALRITKRWIVLTCNYLYIAKAEEMGLPVVRFGIWVKPNASPQFTGDRPGTGWEGVAILHNEGKKKWNNGGHHAVWIHNTETGLHPTQKPLGLVKQWVEQFTDPGETILDPFMGSGTTGTAALEMGRKFIGIELDSKYYKIAEKRIQAADNQNKLFSEEQP